MPRKKKIQEIEENTEDTAETEHPEKKRAITKSNRVQATELLEKFHWYNRQDLINSIITTIQGTKCTEEGPYRSLIL
jgi:hypothetical protein